MKYLIFILLPIIGNCNFIFLSAKWECTDNAIHIKFIGSDSTVSISGSGGHYGDYKTFTGLWISKGVFQPDINLSDGVVHLKIFDNGVLDSEVTIFKNCNSNSVPIKINDLHTEPFGIMERIYFNEPQKYRNLYRIVYFYARQKCDYYKLYLTGIDGPYSGTGHLYDVLNEYCEVKMELFLLNDSGTVLYYSGFIEMPTRLDFQLSYQNGIQYSWNNLPGSDIVSIPQLPPVGTNLSPGRYCFKLCDNSKLNRCQSKSIIVGLPIDTINSGCDFSNVSTGYDLECQLKITNGQNFNIIAKLYKSTDFPGLCYEANFTGNGIYTIKPSASIYLKPGQFYNKIALCTSECTEVRCFNPCKK